MDGGQGQRILDSPYFKVFLLILSCYHTSTAPNLVQ